MAAGIGAVRLVEEQGAEGESIGVEVGAGVYEFVVASRL
jgi:enoyl reductase-like protein